MKLFLQVFAFLLFLPILAPVAEPVARNTLLFVEPTGLEPDIQFWIRIYTRVGKQRGLLHDSRNIHIVYEELELPKNLSVSGTERHVEKSKDRYRKILKRLALGNRKNLTSEERRILGLFPPEVSNKTLLSHTKRIRFQLGQADQFRAGLVRAGTYADHIQKTLRDMNLPPQLAALPHVESSYTPGAYSRVGAAGLWQFTRPTGRRYMRVDQIVDERLDPYKATAAAARLLAQNRRSTGSWPLAITAYNHGASGMRRASRKLGHRDIEKIIREYRSRRFGFASRNFYVEFVAASRISENPEHYFGVLVLDPPILYDSEPLPFYASAEAVSRVLEVDIKSLKAANPALLSPVWTGQKRIPQGFELKIPVSELAQPLGSALASLPQSQRFATQTRDNYHVVRRGETLSRIAQKYRVPIRELENLNNLRDRTRIRVGQKLRLPIEHASSFRPEGRRAVVPSALPENGVYTIRRGDTLTSIALRFGIDEEELARVNNIRNRNLVHAGQALQFPGQPEPQRPPVPSQPELPENPSESTDLTPMESPAGQEKATRPGSELAPLNLLADPADYRVNADSTIEVQFGETLGHYAEWLDIRAQELRVRNDLQFGEALPIHSRLRLDFSRVPKTIFEEQRIDFQRTVQGKYFSEWEITGTTTHTLKLGDSIWNLAHQQFKVPLWLLQQYNPDVDFETASAGAEIISPIVERREAAEHP